MAVSFGLDRNDPVIRKRPARDLRPWIFLLWIVAGNAVLSYARPKGILFAAILTLGVLLPLWAAHRVLGSTTNPFRRGFEPLPAAGWLYATILMALAFAVRFWRLDTLSVWPMFDEGVYSYAAIEMLKGAPPILFYGNSQAPPLFFWCLAGLYRIGGVSLENLWLLPALFSILFVPLAWWAARIWWGRSGGAVGAFLAALSFLPMYLGRFSMMTVTVLPFMALAFGTMGKALRTERSGGYLGSWIFFGAVLGAGFYSHLHWFAVAPVLLATALEATRRQGHPVATRLGAMAVPMILLPLPLLIAAFREGYGVYLAHLWAFKPSAGSFDHLGLAWQYLASLFWGVDPEHCTYQPVWGGFLNPLLGAFFFLGFMATLQRWREPRSAWWLAAFLAWMAPGWLTRDLETFRLTPVLPVLFAMVWVGLARLMGPDRHKNLRWVLVLGVISFALDANHLFNVYAKRWEIPRYWAGHTKSLARARAFSILREKSRTEGPGLVFSRFVPGLPDPTLEVAAYSFNPVDNPSLDVERANWAAFLVNVNYENALKRIHPFGRAHALDEEGTAPDGGWMLYTAPILGERERKRLEPWLATHRAMGPYWSAAMNYVYGTEYVRYLPALMKAFESAGGDEVLLTLRGEIEADALFKGESLGRNASAPAGVLPYEKVVQTLEKTLRSGAPVAHLYFRLGQLRWGRGETALAREAFEAAVRCSGDRTRSREMLAILSEPSKEGP